MAQRRMFSKTITNSSEFLMMPEGSQNLYFHLGMNADDDGFCEHFAVMRMTNSNPDNLKLLQAKGFIYVFDEKVLVIIDWKVNNLLRSDRYTPSRYLQIYENQIKHKQLPCGLPLGIPMGDAGKDSIGKDRKGKDSIGKDSDEYYRNEYFEVTKKRHNEYLSIYPNIDIDKEYIKMKQWLDDNPEKRKSDYPRFITNWLGKATPKKEEVKEDIWWMKYATPKQLII